MTVRRDDREVVTTLRPEDPRPFLSIVAWPDGWSRDQTAQLLEQAAGLDAPTLRLRLGQAPPTIIGIVEPDTAQRAIEALRREGGDGFTATLAQLVALGPTLKIKDLRVVGRMLEIDLWRGPSTTIRAEDVQILIRAHLTKTEIKRDPTASHIGHRGYYLGGGFGGGRGTSMASAGAYGLALGFGAAYAANYAEGGGGSAVHRDISTSDKLDIHTRNGLVYQIDGDKFAYVALGEMRGHGDKANMDAMCELLAHVTPNEIVDPYFTLWTPPPGHERLRLPQMKMNNDDPAFAFYSRWAALMYRHLLGI